MQCLLSEPLPLIPKGKYEEPKFDSKRKKGNQDKLNIRPNDAVSWYEPLKEGVTRERDLHEQDDHICQYGALKSKIERCCICGRILDRNYNNCAEITQINFLFPDPIFMYYEPRGTLMQTIARPSSSTDMQDFLLYSMGTNFKSINEIFRKQKVIPHRLTKYLTHRTQKSMQGEDLLRFDSNFESGNLAKVYCISDEEYDLFLNVDTNTKGHTQWFFFSVACSQAPGRVTFNIRNCCKNDCSFVDGMKVAVYSVEEFNKSRTGWHLGGEKFQYTKSTVKREVMTLGGGVPNPDDSDQELDEELGKQSIKLNQEQMEKLEKAETPKASNRRGSLKGTLNKDKVTSPKNSIQASSKQGSPDPKSQLKKKKFSYYTLSFTYNFTNHNDLVYFAYFKPYTLTDLIQFLTKMECELNLEPWSELTMHTRDRTMTIDNQSHEHFQYKEFTPVEITTNDVYYKREKLCNSISGAPLYLLTITAPDPAKKKKKKGIFLTARVHAGENTSSFVTQGIIKFLISKSKQARSLRDMYIFKIVPMLNPEGVACGNNRTCPTGADLNRRWHEPNEKLHPEIFYTKQAISDFAKEREILLFCDIHGHSSKKNAFLYGCNTAANGGFCSWTKVRLFPRIFARKTPMISLNDCCFRVTPDKVGTARVTVWKEFKVTNSFTLEVSMWGYDYGNEVVQFNDQTLEKLGVDFCLSILEYTYVWSQLTTELMMNGGWLKPNRLLEVTGTPAQQIQALRLKEEKEEQRRLKLNIKKVRRIGEYSNKRTPLRKNPESVSYPLRFPKPASPMNRETREPREFRDFKEFREARDKESRETKETRETRETREAKETIQNITHHYYMDYEEKNATVTHLTTEGNEEGSNSHEYSGELSFVENVFNEKNGLLDMMPGIKEDWREYFNTEELHKNYDLLENGIDPNELERSEDDSDSDGSCFALDKDEEEKAFQEIYKKRTIKPFIIKGEKIPTRHYEAVHIKEIAMPFSTNPNTVNSSLEFKKGQLPGFSVKLMNGSSPPKSRKIESLLTNSSQSQERHMERIVKIENFMGPDSYFEELPIKKVRPAKLPSSLQPSARNVRPVVMAPFMNPPIDHPHKEFTNYIKKMQGPAYSNDPYNDSNLGGAPQALNSRDPTPIKNIVTRLKNIIPGLRDEMFMKRSSGLNRSVDETVDYSIVSQGNKIQLSALLSHHKNVVVPRSNQEEGASNLRKQGGWRIHDESEAHRNSNKLYIKLKKRSGNNVNSARRGDVSDFLH